MNSLFSVFDISKEEHQLVLSAHDKYGEAFNNACELVELTANFIESADLEVYIFISYLSHFRKSLLLSLLSAVRMHEVQAQMNLRQALESGVKGAYAIVFPKEENFVIHEENGTIEEREDLPSRCYRWLEEEYPRESEITKQLKKNINSLFMHANFITTQSIVECKNDHHWCMIFDKEDNLMVKKNLWFIANIAFGFLNLFAKICLKREAIKLINDLSEKISQHNTRTEKIKQELMSHPRFTQWIAKKW